MSNVDMKSLGLSERFIQEAQLYDGLYIGRVTSQYKDMYKIITEYGELTAEISGKFRYNLRDLSEYPAVGDFVMTDRTDNTAGNGVIHHVLTRKSSFIRKVAGNSNNIQIVASNVDIIFICMSLNNDFNLRRLERYLSIAWDSGAKPVIVLTKSDLCEKLQEKINEINTTAFDVDVLVTTNTSEDSYLSIKAYISSGITVAFIGSSGVGKTTIINSILGRYLFETSEIRNDDKGRHTTTRRELIPLPQGGALIDTPGMRELGIISADISRSFADIDELATRCKFGDCTHSKEPNCAVQRAINDGILSKERLESYRKLKKEAKYEGLNSRLVEKEKINVMFSGVGGMKNARKFIKEKNRKKNR